MRRFTSCLNRRRESPFARGDRVVGIRLVLAFACMAPLTVNAAVVANFEVYVLESGHGLPAGQSGPDTKVKNAADGPLLQIPGTGTVFRICRSGE